FLKRFSRLFKSARNLKPPATRRMTECAGKHDLLISGQGDNAGTVFDASCPAQGMINARRRFAMLRREQHFVFNIQVKTICYNRFYACDFDLTAGYITSINSTVFDLSDYHFD